MDKTKDIRTKKIVLDSSPALQRLEALAYEVGSRKDLLSYMIQSGVKPTDDAFKAYHQEYQEFFVQYEEAKAAFQKEAVDTLGPGLSWNLDFATRTLTVEGL